MIDQINELPEDGLKSSPEKSRYIENTWFSRKIKISCTFLHLIDILNDLILIGQYWLYQDYILISKACIIFIALSIQN